MTGAQTLDKHGQFESPRDVVYGSTHPEIQKLDAYLVKAAQPTPVVIEIHGGGWRRGSKSAFTYPGDLIGDILAAGISVVSIDYRLTPQHTMPAQLKDAVRAVQFVRSQAREWNLDPNRIAALGGSAGAHLAAWVALHDDCAKADSMDPVERCSSRLACFVPLSGPMDLTRVRPTQLAAQPLRGRDFANAFTAAFGCTAEQFEHDSAVRQRIRDASPLFLVSGDDPPALVMGTWNDRQALLRDPPVPEDEQGKADEDLCVRFQVRAYQGGESTRVSVVVENCWDAWAGSIQYDLAVSVGGREVFQRTAVDHRCSWLPRCYDSRTVLGDDAAWCAVAATARRPSRSRYPR